MLGYTLAHLRLWIITYFKDSLVSYLFTVWNRVVSSQPKLLKYFFLLCLTV